MQEENQMNVGGQLLAQGETAPAPTSDEEMTAEDMQYLEQAADRFTASTELQSILLVGLGIAAVAIIILVLLIMKKRRAEAESLENFTDEGGGGGDDEPDDEDAIELAEDEGEEESSDVREIKKKR